MHLYKQPCPVNFSEKKFTSSHVCQNSITTCWDYVSNMNTFQGSFWNLSKVEYVTPGQDHPSFCEGTYTNHHGPLLSANGILSTVQAPTYRKMDYFYGSYIFTFRLFRPVALIFELNESGESTQINTEITFFIHKRIPNFIHSLMGVVWRTMMRSLMAKLVLVRSNTPPC